MINTDELRGQAGDAAEMEITPNPELMVAAANELDAARAAIGEFCDRVEAGEVRSTYTYNKFKELLGR